MSRFNKQNMHNIKCIFEEKTGADLNPAHRTGSRRSAGKLALVAAILAVSLLLAAFTEPLFSPLEEDELRLCGTYEGNGIVSVYVENGSDKTLEFEKKVKLYNWGSGEEVEQLDNRGMVVFENTKFEAHSSGTMMVDLSDAYDIEALESAKPSESGTVYYYLLLTNNSFLFGHDWMCSFHFTEETVEETVAETEPEAALLAAQNIDAIEEDLRFYFEDAYYDELPAFNQLNFEYLQKVQEVLLRREGTLVRPVDPWITIQRDGCVFDPEFPMDIQYQLVGLNYHSIDGYNRIVGSMFSGGDSDHALTLKALLPGYKGQTNGGHYLPLIYLFIYEKSAMEVEDPYAFIYGQIITFEDMEQYIVYEDERYVIYEVTDLFYTDLDAYIDYFVSTNDVYFDEQIRERVHNIYDYYKDKESLRGSIVNRQAEAEAKGYSG